MPNDDQFRLFAEAKRAVVVAPAGCGKTELIARAVNFCPTHSRQLILTHTHAGVDAIRTRLRNTGVPASRYHVETIHSFALRYAAAYPKSSAIRNVRPHTNEDYADIVQAAHKLMKTRLIRQVLSVSYAGVFVDEYQDCTTDQHDLVISVAEILPCRIVGDPLQGIFAFGDNHVVDWDLHVYPFFPRLPDLTEPWRWKGTNPNLGKWLTEVVRPMLEQKKPILLQQALLAGTCAWNQEVSGQHGPATRIKVLLGTMNLGGTTFVICRPEQENLPHALTGKLHNHYHSIEPITSDKLAILAEAIEVQTGMQRLHAVHNFVSECLTAQQDFDAVLQAIQKHGKVKSDRRCLLHGLAMRVVTDASLTPIAALFDFIGKDGNPTLKRHQLWHEMRRALAEVAAGTVHTLVEAIHLVRNRGAILGRRIPKRCISRTLLLKGLECEHAVVIDADAMDTKNLYVALTRGSKTLHILSRQKILWPTDARRLCPKCNSQLALMTGPNGPFLACSTHPACQYVEALNRA